MILIPYIFAFLLFNFHELFTSDFPTSSLNLTEQYFYCTLHRMSFFSVIGLAMGSLHCHRFMVAALNISGIVVMSLIELHCTVNHKMDPPLLFCGWFPLL